MLPDLLAQLDAFCTAHPIHLKVLFAPNEQVGVNLTSALARRRIDCINLQITTPAAWAERHVAPRLQACGWTRLAGGSDRFLLQEVVDDLEQEASLRPLPSRGGILLRTIRDVRAAGITPSALRKASLPAAKREALARVLDAYETRLAAEQLYDVVTLLREGAKQAVRPEAAYAILDTTPLSEWALRFVRAYVGDRIMRMGQPRSEGTPVAPPPDSPARRWEDAPREEAVGALHPAASLWSMGLTPDDRTCTRLRTAPGARAAVRGVLRDVLSRDLPFDQVEIAYTAEDPYLNALLTAAERFDVPMTFATGRPVLSAPSGQALRGFFRWMAQGFDTAVLTALCRARLLTFDRDVSSPPAGPAVAAVLERGHHGPGRHRHRHLIARLEDRCDEDGEAEREQLYRARRALDALADVVPDGGAVTTTNALADAGITFLMRFDGLTGRPAPQHALGDGRVSVSASRLETLAACPYRYFLKYVLDVEPPDAPEDDPTRWLDPLQFGQLLHELFHTFMDRLDGDVPDLEVHGDTLRTLLEQKTEAYRDRILVQHEAAFRADRRRLERAARVFLAAEAQQSESKPVAFELSFGQGVPRRPHRPTPVIVALNDDVQLQLEGRIDRVDPFPNGDYAIWDYKTGSMHGFDEQDLGAAGQRLQWVLYAYAFEDMLAEDEAEGTVARSGYFFANDRAYGQRLAASPPPRETLAQQLEPLLDLAAQGAFPHVQKRRRACAFCDYRRICADESKTARDVAAIIDATAAGDAVCEALARWMDVG